MPARARPWQYALIALLAAFVSIYQARYWWDLVTIVSHPERHPRQPIVTSNSGQAIRIVRPEAEAAGVRIGDRLNAVAGRPYVGRAVYATALRSLHPGDRLPLTVTSAGGEARAVSVLLAASDSSSPSLGGASSPVIDLGASFIVPAFCYLVGFAVVLLRPWDPIAWMLLAIMLGFSGVFDVGIQREGWEPWLRPAAITYHAISSPLWAMGMMLFGIYFPERLSLDRRLPFIKWLTLSAVAAGASVQAAVEVASTESFAAAQSLQPIARPLGPVGSIAAMVAIGFFFFALGTKSGTMESPDARRRVGLLWGGAELSLTPAFVFFLIGLVRGRDPSLLTSSPWFVVPFLLMLLFPFTMAYVIVVQRALDLRVAIRQGLQYALARGGVRAVQLAISMVVFVLVVDLASRLATNRTRLGVILVCGPAAVVMIGRSADRLRRWIDRRFFREAYNAERVLTDLTEDVRMMVEITPLMETVAQKISATLHVPRLAFVLNRGEQYVPAFALGYGGMPRAEFSASRGMIKQLGQDRTPLRVYFDDPDSWVNREGVVNPTEREALEHLDAQLLLPLTAKNKLLGFISLGPKLSEEPYSNSDIRLLAAVAAQAGMALENGRLTEAIATEVARRERLNRELEIAREVQERLFPQDQPHVSGLDYAGHCRPARGVGGDYYDFIALDDGAFGLAIGDVSGKGIPAALLMASLQASIRAQAITGDLDISRLMTNVNRLTYEATPSNRYATLFYGRYEPASRTLTYVNAGHNAPMLIRAVGEPERLEVGGPVIGLLYPAAYAQAQVRLRAGDVMLLFTDGISEAMNPAEEEWGEENLRTALLTCCSLPARETAARLFAAADAFVAGAAQYDDMTLVVVKAVTDESF